MNYRMICSIIGRVVCAEAAFMLPPLFIAAFSGERAAAIAFAAAIAVSLALALPFVLTKPKNKDIFMRDGFITVGLMWVVVSVLGALPYCFSGVMPGFVDCLFESVSGFSTTGGSIMDDIEALPTSILYWRSFTNWLGGMGVLVFLLVLSPLVAKDSGENMYLLRAESPGIRIAKLVPRMKNSATILYLIYIALTLILFILLLFDGLTVFDALTLSFSTAGTGGFSIYDVSVAAYRPYVRSVVALFMFLFSINFNVYFLILTGRVKRALKSEELRIFFLVVILSSVAIMPNIRHLYGSFGEVFGAAFFQVTSIVSTTGFTTENFDVWPQFSKTLLALLMFLGGCGGSTAGGLKVSRITIQVKAVYRAVYQTLHPNTVRLIHMDGDLLDEETVNGVQTYMMIYFLVLGLGTLLVSLDQYSLQTNFTAVLSCLSNVGPGMGSVGPTMNYAGYSGISKLILCVVMLIGRLEIYPIIVLFFPKLWKR